MATLIGGGWLADTPALWFNALQEAAKKRFGVYMPVTSAGRSVAEQWAAYNRYKAGTGSPAYPGDSPYALHVVGGGRAVDIGGRFQYTGTAEHNWLRVEGPKHGFAVDAVQGEPWHIQFTLTPSITAPAAETITILEPESEHDMITLFNSDDPNDATRRAYYDGLTFELQSPVVSAQERIASRIIDVDQKTWDQLKANANRRRSALIGDIASQVAEKVPARSAQLDAAAIAAAVAEDLAKRLIN